MPFLNAPNGLFVFFFAGLLVWLPACSMLALQETRARSIAEANRLDTDEKTDSAITAEVKAAFAREPLLKAEEIVVGTNEGNVRLTGNVSSILVMEKAVEVARAVKGVKAVKDEMQFRWQY